MDKAYDLAIYIGRFQPVHYGHLDTIRQALDKAQYLLMFLGSAQESRSKKNPFTVQEREQLIIHSMIEQGYDADMLRQSMHFRPSHDGIESAWKAEIQEQTDALAQKLFPEKSAKIALIGYYKDDSSYYIKEFPNWSLLEVAPFIVQDRLISATDIRNAYYNNDLEPIRPFITNHVYTQLTQKELFTDIL